MSRMWRCAGACHPDGRYWGGEPQETTPNAPAPGRNLADDKQRAGCTREAGTPQPRPTPAKRTSD